MKIERYTVDQHTQWNEFVEKSRNGTFLFSREFMDYHSDRFTDHSLLAYDNQGRIIAVLPANETLIYDSSLHLYTHQGLTYGGWVVADRVGANEMLTLFDLLVVYLKSNGFSALHYKIMPDIYHRIPTQEDQYALWRLGARIEVCNLSTTIDLRTTFKVHIEQRRRRGLRKALNLGYVIKETEDLSAFWTIVEDNLQGKYGVSPVHTYSEINLLKQRFPHAIRCFVAQSSDNIIEGGIILMETPQVAHSQYPHATTRGKHDGVMDFVFSWLIDYYSSQRPDIRYFDFGISNEQQGNYLNSSLVTYKEGFGGRGVSYPIYRIDF